MQSQALRNRYVDDAVQTVAPATLVTMLYDALVRDLAQAEAAIVERDYATANGRLVHAQDVVLELQSGLDLTKWDGAARLADIYAFLLRELLEANVTKDPKRTAACRRLVEPLCDAWHQAARQLAAKPS